MDSNLFFNDGQLLSGLPYSRSVEIDLDERSYRVVIGSGLFGEAQTYEGMPNGGTAVIVTNETVAPIYAQNLVDALQSRYKHLHQIILPDGEEYKNWQSLNLIFDALLSKLCDRKTVIYALGGGVVGDISGFAASVYMRGIPFVQIPTTLLAQVDSSVGGKTGVNHPMGKNMIGAFYQPKLVVCDLDTLKTLPLREFSAGLAEVIKYGPIADMAFMDWLDKSMDVLRERQIESLVTAVHRSCEIKANIVSSDEREGGARAILNFGHTFGHAIEAGMGYGAWLHGEGVAVGMIMAAELSQRMGMVDALFVARLKNIIFRAGLPVRGAIIDESDNAGRYIELMRSDKKSEAGEIRFVLLDGPGNAVIRSAPDSMIRDVIDACCA